MSPEVEYVEVQLELGHQADPHPRNAPDGFTHQWTLFVRGPDHCKIEEFVEKVIFNLHDSFPKSRRAFREPPFSVREFGYAGFELAIDIYFKNKEEPKKITYMYDLFLHNNDVVQNTRREKLTFQNPSPDFKKKLLRAGGRCYSESKDKTHPVAAGKQKAKPVDGQPLTPASNPTSSPRHNKQSGQKTAVAIPKQRIPQKDIPTQSAVTPVAVTSAKAVTRDKLPVAKVHAEKGDTFTDLFGPPLPTRPSPDPVKQKERSRKVKTENETKVKHEPKETGNSGRSRSADSSAKSGQKSCRSPSQGAKRERRSSSKRSSSKKKRKRERQRSSSSSSSHDSGTPVHNDSSRKCDSKLKSKAESGQEDRQRTKVKEKDVRSVASAATGASNSSQKSKDVKKENFTSTTISFSNNNNTGTTTLEIKSVKKEKTWDSESKKSKSREFSNEESETVTGAANKKGDDDKDPSQKQGQAHEPSSSPTSVASDMAAPTTANGCRDDVSSPPSPPTGRRCKKDDSGSESDTGTRGKSDSDEMNRSASRQKYLTELLWIQKRINETDDPVLLQQIVDMIEENTSQYEVTETSFDFNILNLDAATLCKLRQIVEKG